MAGTASESLPLPDFSREEQISGYFPAEAMLLVQHPRYGDHSAKLEQNATSVVVELESGGTLAGRVHWGGAVPTRVYMLVHDGFADMNPQYWMFWLGIFLIAAVMLGRGGIMGALSRFVRTGKAR